MQKNKSNTTINTRKMDLQAVANDLFDEIKSRYSKITLGDENASVTTNPSEARFFKFNWNFCSFFLFHIRYVDTTTDWFYTII